MRYSDLIGGGGSLDIINIKLCTFKVYSVF